MSGNLLILGGPEIRSLLDGREREIVEAVGEAYRRHARGETSLPHPVFLRFPDEPANRIIALPAFLPGRPNLAGIKWISSFPGNHDRGLDRASAVVIVNSAETGRPEALLEGSIVSAKRTAGSAALAARLLAEGRPASPLGVIGCGPINLEIVRFLSALSGTREIVLFDTDRGRADRFQGQAREVARVRARIARDAREVLATAPLVSLATTALEPHIDDLSVCLPGAVLLHVSLRDLTPRAVLEADNVVDDADHVCRARTSVHLAEEACGTRSFIRCSIGEILEGTAPRPVRPHAVTIFSPFGLGILDLAVAAVARDLAAERGLGTIIPSFLPESLIETPVS
jgi:ornithine cyclodeaminase